MTAERWTRLALLVPAAVVYAVLAAAVSSFGGRISETVVGLSLAAAPVAAALWVLSGVHVPHRAMAAVAAPAVGAVVVAAFLAGWTLAGSMNDVGIGNGAIALLLGIPAGLLVAAGVVSGLRGRVSRRALAIAWGLALAAVLVAEPLALRMTALGGNDAIAAIVVLFVPPVALGVWAGAWVAAWIVRRGEAVSG